MLRTVRRPRPDRLCQQFGSGLAVGQPEHLRGIERKTRRPEQEESRRLVDDGDSDRVCNLDRN